jgi:hypothetical protein
MVKKKKSYRQKRSLNLDGPASEIVVDDNVGRNFKYHEIAKEFINNGCRQTLAYCTVTGTNIKTSGKNATRLFRKPFMTQLIRAYMLGDHDAPRTKDWAIKKWTEMVETNVLNFVNDDGEFLSVSELKELPDYVQEQIKKIKVKNVREPLMKHGEKVLDENDKPIYVHTQYVEIELYDKMKALADLARAEKWIENHMNVNVTTPVSAEMLIEAQIARQKRLEGKTIDGESERVNEKD